jgi:hypothetical protein
MFLACAGAFLCLDLACVAAPVAGDVRKLNQTAPSVNKKMNQSELFSQRTDALALKLNLTLKQLAEKTGLSTGSFFGYRKGRVRITNKAWAKLKAAELDAEKKIGEDGKPSESGENKPFRQDVRMVNPPSEKRTAAVVESSTGLNLMGVLRELVEEKERQIVDLRGQLAEKDRQIDRLLGLLDRQTCAVELFATKARAPAAGSSSAPGQVRAAENF